nr:uncharacterized protein LOC494057 isoform X2 [Danio rerio]|eukprot:XP_021333193.1 uncharacterized protein LOC494057 isoform X2 [Danio rerio]
MKTVQQLLHNKFVVVLGDSIQRAVYKDLVLILQKDSHLSASQLKSKGEFSFENDTLVEGGRLGEMNNGTQYREVRQYRTDHHLVRFYFITRTFSQYVESIISDFEKGIKPDLVVVNSCVWDISRYSRQWAVEYRENLKKLFMKLKSVLPEESLVIWNMTMPLGRKILGGFLVPEIEHMGPSLRFDVIEANYFGATLANESGFDVLDLHYQFRFSLQHRTRDGVHWNAVAHRKLSSLLLQHVAEAWGVELPKLDQQDSKPATQQNRQSGLSTPPVRYRGAYSNERFSIPPLMPAARYNNGQGWVQGMRHFNDLRPQFDDFRPRVDNFRPRVDDFRPRVDDFRPRYDDFRPQFNDFGPQLSGFGPQFSIPPYLGTGYPSHRGTDTYY